MPLGTGNYNLGGQFAFPRSYIHWIAWNISGYAVEHVGNVYYWTYNLDSCIMHTITLNPHFYAWSSNRYTLDHVIDDYYYQLTCGGTKVYPDFSVNYYLYPPTGRLMLEFRYQTLDFGVHTISDLPPQLPGYWLAPPF